MCGQFHIEDKDLQFLKTKYKLPKNTPIGDIRPTQLSLVLLKGDCDLFQFGLSRKSLIINAKVETLFEKPTFKMIVGHPCVIPASYYYEWDELKNKVSIYSDSLLYFAGLYSNHQFVILTTEANESIKGIHHRMPLVLTEEQKEKWLNHDYSILDVKPKALKNNRKIEQISLF